MGRLDEKIQVGVTIGSFAPIIAINQKLHRWAFDWCQEEADFIQSLPLRGCLNLPPSNKIRYVENIFCGIKNGGTVDSPQWDYATDLILPQEKICFESPAGCVKYLRRLRVKGVKLIENELVEEPFKPDLLELTPHHGVLPSEYLDLVRQHGLGLVFDTFHTTELPQLRYVSAEYITNYWREGGFLTDRFIEQALPFIELVHIQFGRHDKGQEMQAWQNWEPGKSLTISHYKLSHLLNWGYRGPILLEPSFHHWRQVSKMGTFRVSWIAKQLQEQIESLRRWLLHWHWQPS